jgi:hypothetical protein
MTAETTTKEISEVQKSDAKPVEKSTGEESVVSILATLVKAQEARIDTQEATFGKKFDELATLIKEANKNPVDSGIETENKPKTEDANDVGDKVTIGNKVAPSPKDQASIRAPAVESSGTDKAGLKMENKAEDEDKKEDKKEEVEKTDEDKKEDKKDEIKKSSDDVYEIVKTVRPKIYQGEQKTSVPTGYQVLKAAANGFGETTDASAALTKMYEKFANGDFGNGLPTGGVY